MVLTVIRQNWIRQNGIRDDTN